MKRDGDRLDLLGCGVLGLLAALALGGAASDPDGLLLGVPSATSLILGLLGFVVVHRLGGAAAAVGFAVVPVLLLVGARLPGVAALSGPPLLALTFAGAVAALLTAPGTGRRLFFPVVLALYLVVAWRVQARVGPEGDEPHYLIVADSLLRDHDLDLTQDFKEARYRSFHSAPLEPHFRVRGRHGEIYSIHAIGLSLLLVPAYAVAGYPGASFFMALLAALLALELRELLRDWTGRDRLADGLAWVLALSPPLIHYAGLLFTEIPAALALAFALRRSRGPERHGVLGALAWGCALAFVPWLNVRYSLLPVVVLLYFLSQSQRPRGREIGAAVGPMIVSALVLVSYHSMLYGFFDPRRVYGRRPEFAWATLPEGLAGLLLDQEFGLLVYAPLFALALPGIGRLRRVGWREATLVGTLIVMALLTAGSWDMWRGGFNPPARFLVPLLPAMALAVAAQLEGGLSAPMALLLGWGLWTGLSGAWYPELVHRDRDGTSPFFRSLSGAEEWTALLPGYVLATPKRGALAAVWGGALALAVFVRRHGKPTASGFAAASLGLVAAAGLSSRISATPSGPRDAVRVIGRPAVLVPGLRIQADSSARWPAAALSWGPLYEPHRYPAGAPLAERLDLPAGSYTLRLETNPGLPASDLLPELVLVEERRLVPQPPRRLPFSRELQGLTTQFDIDGAGAITLGLEGGGPLLLHSIELKRSTFPAGSGLTPEKPKEAR
jgi:hypothetical protein